MAAGYARHRHVAPMGDPDTYCAWVLDLVAMVESAYRERAKEDAKS